MAMRTKTPLNLNFDHLTLPAQDFVRGVRATLSKTSHVLKPVEESLPGPLKTTVHEFNRSLAQNARDVAGSLDRLLDRGGNASQSAGLDSIAHHDHAATLFAKIASHGLEYSLRRLGCERLLVSSTLAAVAYRSASSSSADPLDSQLVHAARLCVALVDYRVAARAPGTPLPMTLADLAAIRIAAIAVALWILVERTEPQENETEILTLCIDLAAAQEADIAALEWSEGSIAQWLVTNANLI